MSARAVIIHHSLNAGEVSPRFAARQDQNKYNAACETLQNFIPRVVGGVVTRSGTQYVTETKTVTDHQEKRLISFVASRDAAYLVELGHLYARFFKDGAPVMDGLNPHELVLPYADTDLAEIITVQSIDVMYLLHRNYETRKLSRIAVDEFTITTVNFDPPALIEEEPTGTDLGGGTLTPAAITGDGITFIASGTPFLASDVGRIIVSGGSRAVIVTVTDSAHVDADIIDDFLNTNPIAADDWRLRLSPQTTLDVEDNRKEVNEIATLTAAAAAFRAADLGKYITIFSGLVRIDQVTDSTHVRGTIKIRLSDITDANPSPTRAWTLEIPAWSDDLGWPSSGCFFQERLWLCKGLTINGSVTNDFENFGKGGEADDAIARTLSDDDIDSIVWAKAYNTLKIATGSGIYEVTPTTQNGALTPTSFQARPIDSNGGARIAPLRITPVMIYVDVSGNELRELSYSFAEDNFKSPHLFRLAEHLMEGYSILELTASHNPDNIAWVTRNDGVLLGLVYEQGEQVIGWFRVVTDGEIKSCAVIPRPSTGKDWVWIIVERDNGIFIEHFEPDHAATGREWASLQTDSAVVTTHDANFLVTGLDHLEGQIVRIVGDGMLFVDQIVTDGEVTMSPQFTVTKVEVGLPYDCIAVPVEPAIPPELGGPFISRGYAQVGVRIRKALGLTLRAYRVNMTEPGDDTIVGEQLVYRKPYHAVDAHVPLQRGKKCILNLGYDPFARIEVKQNLPFPAEILNVVGRLHVGDEWDCDTYNDVAAAVEVVPPIPPPDEAECPEDTVPAAEAKELSDVTCYSYDNGVPPGSLSSNSAGQMNFVVPGHTTEFIATVGTRSAFGTSYPPTANWQVIHAVGAVMTTVTPVPLPATDSFTTFLHQPHAGLNGHSDEMCYMLAGNYNIGSTAVSAFVYFSWPNQTVTVMNRSGNVTGTRGHWAKRGNDFYIHSVAGFTPALYRWNMADLPGSVAAAENEAWGATIIDICRSENFLWVLESDATLRKCDPTTLAVIASFATGVPTPVGGLYAAGDDIVYLLNAPGIGAVGVYYFVPSTSTLQFIDSGFVSCPNIEINNFNGEFVHFEFKTGYFYITSAGALGGETSTQKFGVLNCPGTDSPIGTI